MRWGRAMWARGLAVAVSCGAACASERAPEAGAAGRPVSTVEGRVVRRSGETLVVRAPGDQELALRVPHGSEVTVGSVQLSRGAIRPGSEVRAAYEVVGDTPTAVHVDVIREGGAWMSEGSRMHRGVSPDFGSAAPPHTAHGRAGGSDRGPAATAGGGQRSGGPAGGGIHGPEAVEQGPPPPPATWNRERR